MPPDLKNRPSRFSPGDLAELDQLDAELRDDPGFADAYRDHSVLVDQSEPSDHSGAGRQTQRSRASAGAPVTALALKDAEQGTPGRTGHADIGAQEAADFDISGLDARLNRIIDRTQQRQSRFTARHRKGLIWGILLLLGGGGGFAAFTIISGPLQLIQAANFIHDVKTWITDAQTGARYLHDMSALERPASGKGGAIADKVRRSRLGITGNIMANRLMNRMDAQGITFDTGALGQDRGMTIDYSKYQAGKFDEQNKAIADAQAQKDRMKEPDRSRYPSGTRGDVQYRDSLRRYNATQFDLTSKITKQQLVIKTSIEADMKDLGLGSGDYDILSDGTVHIHEDISKSSERKLIYKLDNIGRWNLIAKLQARLALTKIGKISSFHPIKKREAAALRKLEDWIAQKAGEIAGKAASVDPAAADTAKQSAENDQWQKEMDQWNAENPDNEATSLDDFKAKMNASNSEYATTTKKAISDAGDKAATAMAENAAKDASQGMTSRVMQTFNKLTDVTSKMAWPLIILQVACMMQGLLSQAGPYKQANIVNVAESGSAFVLGLGAQSLAMQDIDMGQIGEADQMVVSADIPVTDADGNPTGKTTFSNFYQAQSVCAEMGQNCGSAADTPVSLTDIAKAGFKFASDQVNAVLDGIFNNLGMSALCTIYNTVQEAASVLLTPITWPIEQLLKATGADKWLNNLMSSFTGWLYGDPLNLAAMSPVGWGAVAMYGGQFLVNEILRAIGGTPLSASQAAVLRQQQNEFLAWREDQKPLLARLFDPTDWNSTINQVARAANLDTSTRNPLTQLGNVVKFFGAVPTLFANAIGQLTGSAGALSPIAGAYDYGVPTIAFSDDEMTKIDSDDSYDMWANTDTVQNLLDGPSGPALRDSASKCWGVTIGDATDGYSVTSQSNVDGTQWNYVNSPAVTSDAGCMSGDTMLRLRTFILDSNIISAGACLEGDNDNDIVQQACTNQGVGAASAPTATDMLDDLTGNSGSSTDATSVQRAWATQASKNGGDYDGSGSQQCVDITHWYLDKYTDLTYIGDGYAAHIVKNVASKNGLSVSDTPVAPAIYSVAPGVKAWGASGSTSNGCSGGCGHTGVVLAINGNQATVLQTWKGDNVGSTYSTISTFTFPASGVTFLNIPKEHQK